MYTSAGALVHAVSGVLGLLIITTFFLATLAVEWNGDPAAIAVVKRGIAWGLVLLVPTMAVAGLSGARRAGASNAPRVRQKQRRMRIIAANGVLVLVPCALVLHVWAEAGRFDVAFYGVQIVELIAGPVNILLMSLNVRDGLRLSGRLPRR